jgi:hypothetical protein
LIVEGSAADIRIGGSFDATHIEGFARLVQSGFGLVVKVDDERIVLAGVQQSPDASAEVVRRGADDGPMDALTLSRTPAAPRP